MTGRAHESYDDHFKAEGPSDRSFGLTIGIILIAIGAFQLLARGAQLETAAIFAGPGALLVILAVLAPQSLALPNRLWMKLGELLARIMNPIIMLLMFVILFVPPALVMRLIGRDALRLRPDPDAKSYWLDRDPPGPAPNTIVNTF